MVGLIGRALWATRNHLAWKNTSATLEGVYIKDDKTVVVRRGEMRWIHGIYEWPKNSARFYNEDVDAMDTVTPDGRWASTGTPVRLWWPCGACQRRVPMDCSCRYKTEAGLYVKKTYRAGQFHCVHVDVGPQPDSWCHECWQNKVGVSKHAVYSI